MASARRHHACCPTCRIRFTAAAAHLAACPECGEPMHAGERRAELLGFRLFRPEDLADVLPEAIAVAIAPPTPRRPPVAPLSQRPPRL